MVTYSKFITHLDYLPIHKNGIRKIKYGATTKILKI